MAAESRRLAAVMFTDIVGYTALTQLNEGKALELLDRHNRLLRPIFPRFRGREIKTIGDSFLVEFGSALDATECAVELQRFLRQENATHSAEDRVRIRVGIHSGDVVHTETDVLGDSVNIASRIEALAEPEGVCVTGPVHDAVHNQVPYGFERLEPKPLKNVRLAPTVYRIVLPWSGAEPPLLARTARNRIAVLPFANMSPNPDDAYFADGLTEELISVLAEVPGARVIGRTSVEVYKKREKPIREIGTELHVGSVLEGSVRRAGERVRITVQLLNTDTEEHLWAARFDRTLEDVFAIQTEIARNVAENLRTHLSADVGKDVRSPVAVNAESHLEFLKGQTLLRDRTRAALREAKARFARAIALDESNARAHVGLADVLAIVLMDYSHEAETDSLESSRAHVERALELDPGLGEAHGSLGRLLMFEYRMPEAEREFALALTLNPSYAPAHTGLGILFASRGRLEDAVREYRLHEEGDPLAPVPVYNQVITHASAGQLDEARAKLLRVGELTNRGPMYEWAVAVYAFFTRDLETALHHVERLELLEPDAPTTLSFRAYYHALMAQRQEAEAALQRLRSLPGSLRFRDDAIARTYAYLGDSDECFRWLERGFENRGVLFFRWRRDPLSTHITDDARFHDLLKRANLE